MANVPIENRNLWTERSVERAIDYVLFGQGDELPDFDGTRPLPHAITRTGTACRAPTMRILTKPATAGGTDKARLSVLVGRVNIRGEQGPTSLSLP
jgi:hypothetical protein